MIYSENGYYVELIKDLYHVFVPDITQAYADSAYKEKDLAITRCKYLAKSKI